MLHVYRTASLSSLPFCVLLVPQLSFPPSLIKRSVPCPAAPLLVSALGKLSSLTPLHAGAASLSFTQHIFIARRTIPGAGNTAVNKTESLLSWSWHSMDRIGEERTGNKSTSLSYVTCLQSYKKEQSRVRDTVM